VGVVIDNEVLYNFGVLTKRYELVSRTASQLAPGVAGVAIGFVLILAGAPIPLAFASVVVGFWFAIGKVPFGRHRGIRVRSMVGPLVHYGWLHLRGRHQWDMPPTWLTVATRAVEEPLSTKARSTAELEAVDAKRRRSIRRAKEGRRPPVLCEQLPPELGRLRWMAVPCGGAEAGLLVERSGRRRLFTAVISVSGGDRFAFSAPDEQSSQIFQWGEVLKAMAAEGPGLRRLQWVERATPQLTTVQTDWSAAAMRDVSGEEWEDYQSLQRAIGTTAIHHEVYLGVQMETEMARRADALSDMTAELARLCEHLRAVGLRPKLLSRRGIAATLRQWADPTAAERMALWGEESVPPSQAGPATRLVGYDVLRTDGYVHRVGHMAAGPRIDVGTEWMYPLLESAMAGSVRTVSMHLEAVSTEQALAEVRDARTTGAVAQRKRDEKGIITTEEEERRVDEARSRERELTRGYRQHKIAGLVMVSSPDPETTERGWRLAQRKAVECHLDLREFHARGHEAWAATLPLCRLRFSRGLL